VHKPSPTAELIRPEDRQWPLTTSTTLTAHGQGGSGQITAHQCDRTFIMTLDGFNALPPSPRIHTLCTGGEEPHGADVGRSTGILHRSDQVHDVSSTTCFWDDEHTS
jgi:hypothetical protein